MSELSFSISLDYALESIRTSPIDPGPISSVNQIVHPPRRAARFHPAEIGFAFAKQTGKLFALDGDGGEPAFASRRVENAADGVEFAEVKCENLQH